MKLPFLFSKPVQQSDTASWRAQWQALVPPECRNVPITHEGKTVTAYLRRNHFVVMLQDGLLMEPGFFPVCEFFQRAGYHVVWLMRCSQDISGGYLHRCHGTDARQKWLWRKPTTNFGRWTSDNFQATILLQTCDVPGRDLRDVREPILQRVIWAESDDPTRMIPGRTHFFTTACPGTPRELMDWLDGIPMSQLRAHS